MEQGASWRYSVDGGASWTAGGTASASGTASFDISALGQYSAGQIQVEQTDAAGNISITSSGSDIDVQGALNQLSMTLPAITGSGSTTSANLVTVNNIADGASWQYSVDGGVSWLTGSTAVAGTATFTLADGDYSAADSVQVRQMNSVQSTADIANTVVTAGELTVDSSKPDSPFISYNQTGESGQTNDTTVTISGITETEWSYTINSGTEQTAVVTNGIARIDLPSSDGDYVISATQTNEAGSRSLTPSISDSDSGYGVS